MLDEAAGEQARASAARFLNLLITQVVPSLAAPEGGAGAAGEHVEGAVARARAAVAARLGKEAAAMVGRRIDLADAAAEAKLQQLAAALHFFLGGSTPERA